MTADQHSASEPGPDLEMGIGIHTVFFNVIRCEHARLQPFLDQADDAPVADPVLQEAVAVCTGKSLGFSPLRMRST